MNINITEQNYTKLELIKALQDLRYTSLKTDLNSYKDRNRNKNYDKNLFLKLGNGILGFVICYLLSTVATVPISQGQIIPIEGVKKSCLVLANGLFLGISNQDSTKVKTLQQCLRESGDFKYSENTGFFGSITAKALQNYRIREGGQGSTQPSNKRNCNGYLSNKVTFGISSPEVVDFQKCLVESGDMIAPKSYGYYGTLTNDAYKKHIKSLNLAVNDSDCNRPDMLVPQVLVYRRLDNRFYECSGGKYTGFTELALSHGTRDNTTGCQSCVITTPGKYNLTFTQRDFIWKLYGECLKMSVAISFVPEASGGIDTNGDLISTTIHNVVKERGFQEDGKCNDSSIKKLPENVVVARTAGCIAMEEDALNRIADHFNNGENGEGAGDFIIL
jgi:hypothetical protein